MSPMVRPYSASATFILLRILNVCASVLPALFGSLGSASEAVEPESQNSVVPGGTFAEAAIIAFGGCLRSTPAAWPAVAKAADRRIAIAVLVITWELPFCW